MHADVVLERLWLISVNAQPSGTTELSLTQRALVVRVHKLQALVYNERLLHSVAASNFCRRVLLPN